MKHTYQESVTGNWCISCRRPEFDHGDDAECEICGKSANCELISTHKGELLVCEVCHELQTGLNKTIQEMNDNRTPTEKRITELTKQLIAELPANDREMHVKEITSIVKAEEDLRATGIPDSQVNYELAKAVNARLSVMKERFFSLRKEEDELKISMQTDQKYLNNLVPKLREEERAKFKDFDITYKPTVVTPAKVKVSGPRLSASDKAMESAAKMMGLSLEQYKSIMAKALTQVTGAVCTCKETPGICKVHPNNK